jgi:hypothetical protein
MCAFHRPTEPPSKKFNRQPRHFHHEEAPSVLERPIVAMAAPLGLRSETSAAF